MLKYWKKPVAFALFLTAGALFSLATPSSVQSEDCIEASRCSAATWDECRQDIRSVCVWGMGDWCDTQMGCN